MEYVVLLIVIYFFWRHFKNRKPKFSNNTSGGIIDINYCPADLIPDDFIVIDVETTGLDPNKDEIIEIALVRYLNGEKIDSFTTLIKPYQKIPYQATVINGITNAMVKKSPTSDMVIDDILSRIHDAKYVVGYNVEFDLKFLNAACRRHGKYIENVKVIDVLDYVRKHFSHLKVKKLETMKDYFQIEQHSHRAISDCDITIKVWQQCIEQVRNQETERKIQLETIFSLLNESEKQFITVLKEQLGTHQDQLHYNVMSDKTMNFKINDIQIGRVKLSGRKYKMQLLDENNTIWIEISSVDEAINNIKHWMKYVKTLTK
jgi:DNA polymerase-3 subunit epsilon